MRITPYRLADRLLIVPNLEIFFGEFRNRENCLDIAGAFAFKDVADIYLTRLGAIGFHFKDDGALRSIHRLKTSGSGTVPEHVMQNHDAIVDLQGRRLTFANFIAAALFGRLSALRQRALTGAQYAGMDEIVGFACSGDMLELEVSKYADAAIAPKARIAREQPERTQVITPEQLQEAIDFVAHVARREDEFEHASLQACMVMNYQAAILRSEQHAAASLALNFAVAEALLHEIFLAYGIVGGRPARAFATQAHSVPPMSNGQFKKKWQFEARSKMLVDGGLIKSYLFERLDEARKLRNDLMHGAATVTVTQAGILQTAIRDLWALLLDHPFELNASWTMRM